MAPKLPALILVRHPWVRHGLFPEPTEGCWATVSVYGSTDRLSKKVELLYTREVSGLLIQTAFNAQRFLFDYTLTLRILRSVYVEKIRVEIHDHFWAESPLASMLFTGMQVRLGPFMTSTIVTR